MKTPSECLLGFNVYIVSVKCSNYNVCDLYMSDLLPAAASGSESTLQPPPLAYKKWAIQEQEKVLDLCSCGMCPLVCFEL